MPDDTKPEEPKRVFTPLQRAERVLVSQGRSKLLAKTALALYVDRLAEMCGDDGKVKPGTAEKFEAIWFEHIDKLKEAKATDDTTDEQDTELEE